MCSSALAGARSWCAQPGKCVNSRPMLGFCSKGGLFEACDAGSSRSSAKDTERGVRAKWLLSVGGMRVPRVLAVIMPETAALWRVREVRGYVEANESRCVAWEGM